MKKLQDSAAIFFIVCVMLLAAVAIGGVWKIFSDDVIWKSFQTIGILGVACLIIITAGRVMDKKGVVAPGMPEVPVVVNPIFTSLRHLTVGTLIAAVALMALIGVLSIWEVLKGDVISKSLSTMSIAAFASLVIVIACLERENHRLMHQKVSGLAAIIIIIVFWSMFSWVRMAMTGF